jgi:hypothetical protein
MAITYDYIIIGAGFAGILYAHKHKSDNFVILEKNDYIGGRTKNIKWHESFISLGAGVFLPNHDFVIDLCRDFGLKTQDYTSVYHLTDLQGTIPNNTLYYRDFDTIYKSLRKKYFKYEADIKKKNLTFKEFLEFYFVPDAVSTILNNGLYCTYLKSDPGLFLDDEFLYGFLRTEDTKMSFIKQVSDDKTGYDFLITQLLDRIHESNIKLNSSVTQINYNNGLYECVCNNISFYTKKIILATDIKSGMDFNFNNEVLLLINHVYNSVGYVPYIRIYSYHKSGHLLTNDCRTQGSIGKTIIMNDNILMLVYNEDMYATELNNKLLELDKQKQIDFLYRLFQNHNIEITKPDDIYVKYWNVGMHYCKPNFDIENELCELKEKHNIEIIGEVVSKSHGWVNSALSTVK